MAFIIAQGTLFLSTSAPWPPTHITVISATDAKELHDGADVAEDGRFSLDFSRDPRTLWRTSGIEQIAFRVQRAGGPVVAARDPSGMGVWALNDLPLRDLRLTASLESAGEAAQAFDTFGGTTTKLGDAVSRFDAADPVGRSTRTLHDRATALGGLGERLDIRLELASEQRRGAVFAMF